VLASIILVPVALGTYEGDSFPVFSTRSLTRQYSPCAVSFSGPLPIDRLPHSTLLTVKVN
jgi:hypothetical protein